MCCADDDTLPHTESASQQPLTPIAAVSGVLGGMPVISTLADWPDVRATLLSQSAKWRDQGNTWAADRAVSEVQRLDIAFNYTGG